MSAARGPRSQRRSRPHSASTRSYFKAGVRLHALAIDHAFTNGGPIVHPTHEDVIAELERTGKRHFLHDAMPAIAAEMLDVDEDDEDPWAETPPTA